MLGFNNKFIVSMTASFSENKDYDTFLSAANYKILKDLDILFYVLVMVQKKTI